MDVTHNQNVGGEADKGAPGANKEAVPESADARRFDVGRLVAEHPVGTLLGALGVGYFVGGGFFTSLTRRLVSTGLRLGFQLAVLPAVERELAGMAGELGKSLGNLGGKATDPADGPTPQ